MNPKTEEFENIEFGATVILGKESAIPWGKTRTHQGLKDRRSTGISEASRLFAKDFVPGSRSFALGDERVPDRRTLKRWAEDYDRVLQLRHSDPGLTPSLEESLTNQRR